MWVRRCGVRRDFVENWTLVYYVPLFSHWIALIGVLALNLAITSSFCANNALIFYF